MFLETVLDLVVTEVVDPVYKIIINILLFHLWQRIYTTILHNCVHVTTGINKKILHHIF